MAILAGAQRGSFDADVAALYGERLWKRWRPARLLGLHRRRFRQYRAASHRELV